MLCNSKYRSPGSCAKVRQRPPALHCEEPRGLVPKQNVNVPAYGRTPFLHRALLAWASPEKAAGRQPRVIPRCQQRQGKQVPKTGSERAAGAPTATITAIGAAAAASKIRSVSSHMESRTSAFAVARYSAH